MEKDRIITSRLTFLIIGAVSMILQAIVIREFLTVFYGNELCMGMILGSWLISIAAGSLVFTFADRRMKFSLVLFSAILFVFAFLPFIQIFLIRYARVFLQVPSGQYIPFFKMLIWSIAVIFPYGLTMGFSFPLGCKVYSADMENPHIITSLFTTESFGALIGGGLFSFLLVERFSSMQILWGMLIIILFIISLNMALVTKGGKRILTYSAMLFLTLMAIFSYPALTTMNKKTLETRWNSLITGLPLINQIDSKYQNVAITKQAELYSIYGNGEYDFSFPDPYQTRISSNLILSEHPNPKRMLIIGAVCGGFITECLKHKLCFIQYVLLDSAIMKISEPFLDEYDRKGFIDKRVNISFTDGRYWVNRSKELFDVIFLSVPDPSTSMLNRYYTKEFYQSLKKNLTPKGIVALSLTSSENYIGDENARYNASILNTLENVFTYVEICPGDRNYYFACSSENVITREPEKLKERIRKSGISESDFSPYLFDELFYPEKVKYARSILKCKNNMLNTDFKPVTYFYGLYLWDRFSDSKISQLLNIISSVNPQVIFFFLFILFLIRALFVFLRRITPAKQESFNYLITVAVFGFSAMGIEIILIYSYQNLYGYLYAMIGIIAASFMAGLAMGSLAAGIIINKKFKCEVFFISIQALLVIFSFLIPAFLAIFAGSIIKSLSLTASQIIFFCFTSVMGIFNGVIFPLGSALYQKNEINTGRTAGFFYSSDHIGASLGGFAFATLFVPLLGIGYSCFMVSILGIFALLLWVLIPVSQIRGG